MIKKKKDFWNTTFEFLTTYSWIFLVVIITIGALAYFNVLSPYNFLPEPLRTNSWCGDNPDKCVCENYDYGCKDNEKEFINHLSGRLNCKIDKYSMYEAQEDKCSNWRKKTPAELDIDDCQNNPREDDDCKCEEWEYIESINLKFIRKNPEFFKVEHKIINRSEFGVVFSIYASEKMIDSSESTKTSCIKSRPKTECEKGNDDWVEETIIIREGCNEFGCVTGNRDWNIEKATIQNKPVTTTEVIKNETICREKQ